MRMSDDSREMTTEKKWSTGTHKHTRLTVSVRESCLSPTSTEAGRKHICNQIRR